MKRNYLVNLIWMAIACVAFTMQAAEPAGYYSRAEGKTGKELLQALKDIVGPHTTISYDGLWSLYHYSDVGADGYIIDMYSTVKFTPGKNQCGSYSKIGSCYNREHSFPKSWFNDASPMVSDAMHIVPTDGYVNNQRSNYPFGECSGGTYLPSTTAGKALGKLGKSTYPGYSGTVFEPDDIYKGDFARIYMYMAAAYNDRIANWNSDMLAKNNYPAFTTWAVNMLLDWSRRDPVSEKEVKRNQAVYDGNGGSLKQGNRNPFVDHPELAEYIWGDKVGQLWYSNITADPEIIAPTAGSTIDMGIWQTESVCMTSVLVKGVNLNEDLEVTISGNGFTTSASTISYTDAMAGTEIMIYFNAPEAAGTYTGSLKIESSETNAVVVPITVTTFTDIPVRVIEVTGNTFTVQWTDIKDSENYSLYLYDANKNSLKSDVVKASVGKYTFTELAPKTKYYYRIKSLRFESDYYEVTTGEVYPIIDILSDGGFTINATCGQLMLPVLEAEVYTENIDEDVTLTVEGNMFDVSLDKLTWGKQITIDSDGETFYVRLNNVSKVGTYTGVLKASTESYGSAEVEIEAIVARSGSYMKGDVNGDDQVDVADINCIIDVILDFDSPEKYDGRADVNGDGQVDVADLNFVIDVILGLVTSEVEKTTFTETWEGCETGGYWDKDVQGNAFAWKYVNAGIFGDSQKHGELSCRLGKTSTSAIEMLTDIPTGASNVSFFASKWSDTDGDVKLTLSYSTDAGKNWTAVKTYDVTSTTLQQYSADVNVAGNVRFRLSQSVGSRGNIDDIAIVDNPGAKSAPIVVVNSDRMWDAVATGAGQLTVTTSRKAGVTVYDLDANVVASKKVNGAATIALPAGTYVVAVDKQSKKVIIK